MADLAQLRLAAHRIFEEALQAVDPRSAITSAVHLEASTLTICNRRFELSSEVFAIGIGKAATHMAVALEEILGDRFTAGVLTAPGGVGSTWEHFDGGHPLPNEASLAAAKAAFRLLETANHARALVIFLITGGGSAMLEWPATKDISLEELRNANRVLVNCGASISEINAVRRAFSAVKGGKLAARARECKQITLIVSDVPKEAERSVASGPTLSVPDNSPDARNVVMSYGLGDLLPASIMRAIELAEQPEKNSNIQSDYFVLLDNQTALEAAARAARQNGLIAEIAHDISDQPVDEGCQLLINRLQNLHANYRGNGKHVCLISGGEFACPVRGDGFGGRNSETALRLALRSQLSTDFQFVALSAGTDGIDGNSPDAGAIADSSTLERATAIGLDAAEFLRRSDSATFFRSLGDEISTGLTGTNVRDIRILIAA